MTILALDTSTRAGSAAVLRDDVVAALREGDASRTHGERLPAELSAVLTDAGVTLDAVGLLAVASGPGAFTGLRIGLAAMQGLALSRGLPVVGVSALEALAVAAGEEHPELEQIGVWMDAARGEVFGQLFALGPSQGPVRELTLVTEAEAAPGDALWARWTPYLRADVALCGDGATRYPLAGGAPPTVVSAPLLAPAIGRLARRRFTGASFDPPHALQPLYLRRPDVERSRG